MTICITGLNYQATENNIQELFSQYGEVKKVTIILDRETGKPRGTAHVEMNELFQEDAVIIELDGTEWMGKTMKLSRLKPAAERSSRDNKDKYSL